jgi:hypothetical protein
MIEYSVIVRTPQLQLGTTEPNSGEVSEATACALGGIVREVSEDCGKVEGGGWRVLSHDLTRIDRQMIVSFLLCREE